MASVDVAVLIVGGGPVGLTARALLQRWGVPSLLVEKRRGLSPFPRSRLVNVRSIEIFRQLGLEAKITEQAFRPEYGRIRFCDTLLDHDFAVEEMVGINAPIAESPVIGVVTSQDRLEPALLAAAGTQARFGVELTDLHEEPDQIVAALVDHERGEPFRVSASYVIAADGANSTIRERLGVGTIGPGAVAGFTTVVFDADGITRQCAARPAGVYFTAQGAFIPLYPEGGWAWFGPTPPDVEHVDWHNLVLNALGPGANALADVRVLRVQHWTMNAFVAERFCVGRTLLAGDAAHAIPIAGGLGMNIGIADVHNLCWKLAGILQGWAGAGLLETYALERQPVAHNTLRQAVANTQLMLQVQTRRREQQQASTMPPTQVDLPWTDRYFAQLGLVLGAAYESNAILPDGSAPPTLSDSVTDYVPTARPGHRLPHLWLADGRSSLDALGEWFTLFTPDPARWGQQGATPWPVHIEGLPEDRADLYGLEARGAVLVRPDGHVAARWRSGPPSDSALYDTLAAVSCSASP